MFHTPDTETLRLCSVLSSTAFGFVFALVRFAGGGERYFLHWSASAFLYAAVLIGFEFAPGHPVLKSVLLGALAATNMQIVSGLRAFDRQSAFRWWMILPIAGCIATHLLPAIVAGTDSHTFLVTQIGDTLSIAISALIAGLACLAGEPRASSAKEADIIATPSRGRRLAGFAMLSYLPCYAITLVGYVWTGARDNLLALVPMLSDQLLLAILNLGLLAIPAERAAARLRDAALRDPLTGVWNRAGFESQSLSLIASGATLLAIDLDHFKQINDTHGHLAGDQVLQALATVATAEVHSLGGVFGRLGGDEFLAILPASRAPYAKACARQIHDACRRCANGMLEWTVSIGLSQVAHGETDVREALQRADRALYRAKVDGRDKVIA
ncbi:MULTISPECIES: GGDEF domain-containing protein [unclassified Caballeronia]|uniref:GGDEF domain-containing protein n=1 Tax=unclassified Caballeronia TaxID=2646786 RepID=UPI0028633B28|nr:MULTISPECIES: GGDEF domain-containing protein [unclassified Caballeronia]MDR5752245.1 GGDEF domain-containing protein [Caballeronia sp. LZ024]MDR5841763.1 GGDEF domain-containing protein [Caballeronia sp. LZ031]